MGAGVRRFAATIRRMTQGDTPRRLRRVALALAAATLVAAAPPTAQAQLTNAATLMADRVYVDRAGRLIASGSVEVWHGSVRLTAGRVVFDRRRDALEIDGPIVISDGPDRIVLADSAQLSPALREGLITGARVVLHQQMQIAAARVERTGTQSRMESVVASSCRVCATDPTPLWEIRADRVTLEETTNQLTFERAQMRLAGVPVFYAPRLRLPGPGLERSRGILRPVLNAGSALGLSVGVPYFIPFGERHDLTVTPTVSTDGMASLGLRWRAARPNGGIEIGGQISHDNLTTDDLRGYAYVRALFHLANDWRLTTDILGASDRTYLDDYDITDEARLSGHVTLERIRRNQAARVRALGFYSLRPADNNAELPNAALQAELDQRHSLAHTGLGGALRVRAGAQGFARHSSLDGDAGRDVARAHLQLGWRRSGVLPGGVLTTLALDARADHVRVHDDSAFPAPVSRTAAQAMVEFRWPWARTGAGGARHVIEPILQVIGARNNGVALPNDTHTMPELDQGSLFALTRYSGADSPDDGSRINAGLRWTRHTPGGWSSELLAGQIWRQDPLAGFSPGHNHPLGDLESHLLLAGRLAHADGFSLDLRVLLDPANALSRAETNLAWSGARTQVQTRYLFLPASAFEDRTSDLNEWSLDVTRSFGNGWAGRFGWEYDFAQSQFAKARAGLEFRNECLSFDLAIVRSFVSATNPTASTSYSMRIELLGIGGRSPGNGGRACSA